MSVETLLAVIALLLFCVVFQLSKISARLKTHFPTEKERDNQWGQDDPIGHSEAHQRDKK